MVEPDSKQAVDAWVGIGVMIFLSLLFIRYMLRLGEDQFAHLEEAAVEEAGEFTKGETVEERRRKTNALLDVENDPAHDKQQLDVGIEVGGGEDDQHQLPEDHLTVANGKALEQEVAKIRTTATAVVANPNPNVDNAKKAVDERANKRTTKTLKEEQQMQRLQNFAKKEAHRRQRAALLAELRDVHPRGWISVTFVVTFTFAVL
eukprot:g17801.t1